MDILSFFVENFLSIDKTSKILLLEKIRRRIIIKKQKQKRRESNGKQIL